MPSLFRIALLAASGFATHAAVAQQPSSVSGINATIERFQLTAPRDVLARSRIAGVLDELTREPCDREAIVKLGKELQDAGYRRDSANAHIAFSKTCNGVAGSLRVAVNQLLTLSDTKAAIDTANDLIKLEPHQDNGYFLRALAHDRAGSPKRAIDDYSTAIELFGAKERIASVGYFSIARNYEKLGQFCDAVTAIETWIAVNPVKNDTSQTKAMLGDYVAKGKCPPAKSGEDVFPVNRQGNVVIIPVTINGVKGTFIFDTGATYVSMKQAFATKAKIDIDQDSTVKLMTANGMTEGKRGKAKTIQLKTLNADDVTVVVQSDEKKVYGDNIDGLLGMSFLSRFNVTMDKAAIRVTSRATR